MFWKSCASGILTYTSHCCQHNLSLTTEPCKKNSKMDKYRDDLQIIPVVCNTVDVHRLHWNKDNDEKGSNKDIKSSAVDLLTVRNTLAKFSQLQSNTNLNMPPANWYELNGARNPFFYKSREFPTMNSFHMASDFLHCVGKVDVISDAENIKKLLKIPYSKGSVSMMVHRIGNTLLFEDFDINNAKLLRTVDNNEDNAWAWLRKFYIEHILSYLDSKVTGKEKSRSRHSRQYLQQQNLISKFLCHSLASNERILPDVAGTNNADNQQDPPIIDPALDQEQQQYCNDQQMHRFSKNVIWTFEDIRMLIGTDMPIFGGGTHPCLSLRLRDMNKSINILTGIDYWLDNLMCNVPEVVMCYHLDGLVQKYELIATEDLPHLAGSQFEPSIIRDVAQNILSFLKSKATKTGHTYWLFKGKGDDVVKLYDLTSLCTDLNEDHGQNPFTTSVAILLFKVAKNLKLSSDWKQHQGTVLALLKNCLAILDADKYPQVATAALYYLADVYLPASDKRTGPDIGESFQTAEEKWKSDWEEAGVENEAQPSSSVDVTALTTIQRVKDEEEEKKTTCPRSTAENSMKQRCLHSLQHSIEALRCIRNKDCVKETAEPANQTSTCPSQSIPMLYKQLTPNGVGRPETELGGVAKDSSGTVIAKAVDDWKSQWRSLLVEKTVTAYVTLAELSVKEHALNAEDSLSYLRMAALLWDHLDQSLPSEKTCPSTAHSSLMHSHALGVAGDVYFMVVQQWNKRTELSSRDGTAQSYLDEIDRELLGILGIDKAKANDIFPYPSSLQESLTFSVKNYRLAVRLIYSSLDEEKPSDGYVNLSKRLGNASNELGVFYMSKVSSLVDGGQSGWKRNVVPLFQESLKLLEEGVAAFKNINDHQNAALLLSNLGKLYRLQARTMAPVEMKEITLVEWKCYTKALQSYEQSLNVLVRRELYTGIWDAVVWEYTSVLFTLATLLQDYAPLSIKSREQVEEEIVNLLETCIRLCAVDSTNVRQPLYQYRAATCHYRLASLYQDTYRNENGQSVINGKNVRTFAENHYENSSEAYCQLQNWDELIRLQLEYAALCEFQLKHLTGSKAKIRALQSTLTRLLMTGPAISALHKSSLQPDEKTCKCLTNVCTRTQSTLKELTKLSKRVKNCNADADIFGQMYLISLRCETNSGEFLPTLCRMIDELSKLHVALEKK